jgi:hypothetical protein
VFNNKIAVMVVILDILVMPVAIILVLTGMISGLTLVYFVLVFLLVLGIAFASGHGPSLSSRNNTMSEAEMAMYDVQTIQRYIGLLLLVFVVLISVAVSATDYGMRWLSSLCFILVFVLSFSGGAYIFKGKRFRRQGF